MLTLYLQAPFASFRPFSAGSFRPTASFISPSSAYGLLLNVAGIEMRHDDGKSVMTLIKSGLPEFNMAIGAIEFPRQQRMFCQYHNYPVGNTGKEHAQNTKGNKYNISPVRKSFLSGIKAYICIDGNDELEKQITEGLRGNSARKYGLPFLGDNSYLIDRLEPVENRKPAYWFEMVGKDDEQEFRSNVTRLTVTIDRADMSKTRSFLFAPSPTPSDNIPEKAWVKVGY